MTPAKREALFARLAAETPEPRTELDYSSPFELLVAVILSAQATDKSVNLATRELYRVANTPAAIVALGLEGLKRYVRTIGLYNSKAKNILEMSRRLLAEHGGEVPRDRDALEALPGVGRKTANVVLNCVFGEATIAVDTHIFRVANRTGLAPGRNVAEVERGLLAAVPDRYRRHAHHWLILLGRYTCKARRPECWRCLVRAECAFRPKTPAPVSAPRPARRSSPA
ncbi:MAG TPA: endonuclease III [Steroidobacteraceae bacterium]|nr:endonuclease III [Steroidobacteraceae bacterium]